MADPVQAPQVDITASPTVGNLQDPQTNAALQLADSLQGVNEELRPALQHFANTEADKQQAKAQADAFRSSGASYANAVRAGQIEPTQNPWYMRAYQRDSGQIAGQQAVSNIIVDSKSWAEQNDPAAYAAKLNKAVGDVALGLPQDRFSQQGFAQAAKPLIDQASSANLSQNVQQVQQTHIQNVTSLGTQAVLNTLKANPKATSDDIFQSLEAQHKEWLSVGGTEPQWNLIATQAVIGAAGVAKDPTILDHLKDPYLGGEPLAFRSDETGKPMGLQIGQDAFWITRDQDASLSAPYKARQAQTIADGSKADDAFQSHFGADYVYGKVSLAQLQEYGAANGLTPNGVMWAADKMHQTLSEAAGYTDAQVALYSQDPVVQQQILGINNRAMKEGMTPGVTSAITQLVGDGKITLQQGQAMMDRAEGQTHFNIGEGNANRREAEQLKRTDMSLALQRASLAADAGKASKGKAAQTLQNYGVDYGRLPAKERDGLDRDIEAAAASAMEKGPAAASDAADAAAARLIPGIVQRHGHKGAAPAANLANPNR